MRVATLLLLGCASIAACSPDPVETRERRDLEACGATCGGKQFLLNDLKPVVPDANGKVAGWNLDGLVSGPKDFDGCKSADFESPRGEVGIDNQFAPILDEIVKFAGPAFPILVQNNVREGGISYLFEIIDGGEKLQEGGAGLALAVRRVGGRPLLGTDNNILPGQTVELHPDAWMGGTYALTLHEGRLQGGPFRMRLPVTVFGIHYQITFVDARVDFQFNADATEVTGYVGGSFHVDDIYTLADTIVVEELGDIVKTIVPPMADLRSADSGECDRISAVAEIRAIPAFAFPVTR